MVSAPNVPQNIILLVENALLFLLNAVISTTILTNVKAAIMGITSTLMESAKKLIIFVRQAIVKETASLASIITALQLEEDASILQSAPVKNSLNKRITLFALNSMA